MQKKFKIFFNYLLVPILLVWLCSNLYHQIINQTDKADAWQKIKGAFTGTVSWKIVVVLLLMFVNWATEALKWKYLMAPLQQISFGTAYKAVFAGTSFAANTPNRVGEYFGRMIYIAEGKRMASIPLTVTGSFSQLLITLITGLVGLVYYIGIIGDAANATISTFWVKILVAGTAFVTLICLLLYFKISWLLHALIKIPYLQKFGFFIQKVEKLTTALLLKTLLLSLLRYAVFTLQYILVIQAFGISIATASCVCLLSILYLVMSIVPSFVIIEAGIRGKVSTVLFAVVTTNLTGIIASGLFIWLINLMLPAIIGVLLLLGKRVFKKVG